MPPQQPDATGTVRRDWIIRFGLGALVALLAALVGPYSTYERFSLVERLVYWGGMIMVLIAPAVLLRAAVWRLLKGSPVTLDLISAVVIAAVIAPPIWAFNLFVMGFDVHRPLVLAEHMAIGLLICLMPVVLRAYMRAAQASSGGARDAAPTPARRDEPAFLRRLDPDKRGEVWRVSANGHHLDVLTSMGESRVRLRFSDALQELEGLDGTMVHRSHWVAHSAIREIVQDGRRHRIVLQCGIDIPVSQTRAEALRAAGVLTD